MASPSHVDEGSERAGQTARPKPPRTVFSPAALFYPRQLPWTLLALGAALVLARLGFWQLDRNAARLERNSHIIARLEQPPVRLAGPVADPASLVYRKATVSGTFDYANEILLRSGGAEGRSGVHLLTPLRIQGSDVALLVDRGWIPIAQSGPAARAAFRGPEQAAIEGLLRPAQNPPGGRSSSQAQAAGRGPSDTWFSVDVPGIQAQLPYRLLPFYLEQTPPPDAPPLPAPVTDLVLNQGSHLGYAVQWFTFALIGLAGYVAVFARKPAPTDGSPHP